MSDHEPAAWPSAPETPGPTVIEHAPEPGREQPSGPVPIVQRRGGTPLPLTLLLTAALGGGIYYAWTHPRGEVQAVDPGPAIAQSQSQLKAELQAQLQPLTEQLQSLSGRVDALEKRPAASPAPASPTPSDSSADQAKQIADLSAKIDALSAKQDGQAAEIAKAADLAGQKPAEPNASPPDLTAAQAPALQAQQQVADLGHRVDDAFAKQTQADQALAQQKAQNDALEQRLGKLEAGAQGQAHAAQQETAQQEAAQQQAVQAGAQATAKSEQELAALKSRLEKLEQGQGAVQGAARNASRAVRLEAAEAALAAGQPLGTLQGAGPSLARYATVAPPTDADLRARFPAVADAARAASQPDTAHRSFVDRMLARVQQSVTVRRGDHVIVGDPASGVLARAQDAVDRDDLKAAADALDGLTGPAADPARPWVAQVRDLLAARRALADMARG